jgi:hypothetical protein
MQFDPDNKVAQLCADGMAAEGDGQIKRAADLFRQAWDEATTDFEIKEDNMKEYYPSLYLNIGKGYEDLQDYGNARKNYDLAFSFAGSLPDDGYGRMIRSGINIGIERVKFSE